MFRSSREEYQSTALLEKSALKGSTSATFCATTRSVEAYSFCLNPAAMFKNYLKVALRNLRRNSTYVILNILGLGTALAFCMTAYLNSRFDVEFNQAHASQVNTYRLYSLMQAPDDNSPWGYVPENLAENLRDATTGVESVANLEMMGNRSVRIGDNTLDINTAATTPEFWGMFNFQLLRGSADGLASTSQILLSREAAEKLYGEEDALGQSFTFSFDDTTQIEFTVGGIFENHAANSSFYFDALINYELLYTHGYFERGNWASFVDVAFVKMKPGADPQQSLDPIIEPLLPAQNQSRDNVRVRAIRYASVKEMGALENDLIGGALVNTLPPAANLGPAVIAVLMFLLACFALANTSVALASKRMKEIGIRKVLGGMRRQLITQQLGESLLISLIANVFAFGLAAWMVPAYSALWGDMNLQFNPLERPIIIGFALLLVVLTALIAGLYPAFYIARFQPAAILKGTYRVGRSNWLTRSLLVFQFALSVVAVIAGVVFAQNAAWQRTYDYGYTYDNTLFVNIAGEDEYNNMRRVAQGLPGVEMTAGARHYPGRSYFYSTAYAPGSEEGFQTASMTVSHELLELMEIDIKQGRGFDPEIDPDSSNVAIVNPQFVQTMGWADALGQEFRIDDRTFTVIGVTGELLQDDLGSPKEPIYFTTIAPDRFRFLAIRAQEGKLVEIRDKMEEAYNEAYPFKTFYAEFGDDEIYWTLLTSQNIYTIFFITGSVALLLSITGLFALVTLSVQRRRKEIGIRKVMGATERRIYGLVNREYLWQLGLASIIGIGLSYVMVKPLLNMVFTLNNGMGASAFVIAVVICLALAFGIVSYKVIKAARANPAIALRDE